MFAKGPCKQGDKPVLDRRREEEENQSRNGPNGPNVSFSIPIPINRFSMRTATTKPTFPFQLSRPSSLSQSHSLCGRTAISWPFRLLCFRSSLKIQMTSRPHLPSRSSLPFSSPPSIGLSAAAAAADSITSFSSLKKLLAPLSDGGRTQEGGQKTM